MHTWLQRNFIVLGYVACAVTVMLGYVRYDPYQLDGDAISYMDIASSLAHRRWYEAINGLWNPGYPAVLAIAKEITHAGRMQELQVFYWTNFFIFVASLVSRCINCRVVKCMKLPRKRVNAPCANLCSEILGCTHFFVHGILSFRARTISDDKRCAPWALPDSLVYLASFAIIFLSWLNEFSPGKIRVDGLFASLLLLAFGSVVRAIDKGGVLAYFGSGAFLGIAYLVKSPGFVIALLTLILLAFVLYRHGQLNASAWKLALASIIFLIICGPYIAALSLQKHRFDFGDSARLNYAWLVAGTEPQHLLNNQPARFGNSHVALKHSEVELMSNPVVVSFHHFPEATYAPWFDPSYFNEGIAPRFVLGRQIHVLMQESRHLLLLIVSHSYVLVVFVLCIAWDARIASNRQLRGILLLFGLLLALCALMYLSVAFRDRYIAGLFWPACITTLAVFVNTDSGKRGMISGAVVFMSLAILLSGVQTVIGMRQSAIFSGKTHGWYSSAEYGTARELAAHGVTPGSVVSCYRACNTGTYWARLAGVRITSEIYDPKYMSDAEDGNSSWSKLPNKAGIFQALKATGSKGLIGLFEQTPAADEGWEHLEGMYYFHRLSTKSP